jgi:mono/diheme cytochrome c family protein
MIESVTNGRSGTAMSAWKSQLSQSEIESIVDYVRNTFMPAASGPDSSRGRAIYSKNCSVCHGEKGDGRSRAQGSLNPPPRDFTTPGAREELTQQRMITSVTFGRANTAMAGFKTQLSQADISAVVEYIREGFMRNSSTVGISGIQQSRKEVAQSGPNTPKPVNPSTSKAVVSTPIVVDMSAPMPNALIGNADKGKHFYMQNCATCHGVAGDGQGPRAYFIIPKPRNFLHPASRQGLNRVKLFKMISEGERGTEMPAWNKVLTPQEIANVAEFVFQQFIQSNATNSNSTKVVK